MNTLFGVLYSNIVEVSITIVYDYFEYVSIVSRVYLCVSSLCNYVSKLKFFRSIIIHIEWKSINKFAYEFAHYMLVVRFLDISEGPPHL